MKNVKKILVFCTFALSLSLCSCVQIPVASGGVSEHRVLHWETVTEVGCESEGFRFGICVDCKNEVRDTQEPLGHDFRGGECVRCGKADPDEKGASLADYAEYEFTEDGLGYALVGIGSFKGKVAVVPAEHEGIPVLEIGAQAFAYNDIIEELVIPDSVVRIGNGAFRNCVNLEKVNMGDGVTSIGDYAFRECTSLRSVKLSESLKTLGASCFARCDRLEYVEMKSCREIGDYAFSRCEMLKDITFPENLRSIGGWAFEESGITSANLTDGVKSIGSYAFYGSAVREATIPKDLESMNSGIFQNCIALESAMVKNGGILLEFEGCENLKTLIIEEGVELSLSYSLGNLTGLETLYLPRTVKYLGRGYLGCTSAKKIVYSGTQKEFLRIYDTEILQDFSDTAIIECTDATFTVREYFTLQGN